MARTTLFSLLFFAVAGCANFNSVYRPLESGSGALIDIKQRAIIAAKPAESGKPPIVCAEPSPDALSAYAAQLAADAKISEKAAAQLAASFQESGAFVGLRTQSIQLLRDALYRLCEGYMSGALSAPQYDILMRRYQKYMVALLGIEQLTGVVRVPPVTINTSGSAEVARSVSSLRAESEAIDVQIRKLEEQKTAQGVTDARKAEIDKEIAERKADKEAINQAIQNGRGLLTKGSGVSTVVQLSGDVNRSDDHVQKISSTVEKIVLEIINTDDTGQLCFSYLTSANANINHPIFKICSDFLENMNKEKEVVNKAGEQALEQLKGQPNSPGPRSSFREFLREFKGDSRITDVPRPKLPTS